MILIIELKYKHLEVRGWGKIEVQMMIDQIA